MARQFGVSGLAEARAYLAHPVLGARLRECVGILLATPVEATAESILGFPDDLKLRSSLTLFHAADPEEPLVRDALARFYDGQPDKATLARL